MVVLNSRLEEFRVRHIKIAIVTQFPGVSGMLLSDNNLEQLLKRLMVCQVLFSTRTSPALSKYCISPERVTSCGRVTTFTVITEVRISSITQRWRFWEGAQNFVAVASSLLVRTEWKQFAHVIGLLFPERGF